MPLRTDEQPPGAVTRRPGDDGRPTHATSDSSTEALFEEARRRRRRRWTVSAVALALLGGGLIAVLSSGRPGGAPPTGTRHGAKPGPTATGQRAGHQVAVPRGPYTAVVQIGEADAEMEWAADGLDLYLSTDAGHTWRTVTPPIFTGQSVFGRIGSMVAIGQDDLWLPVEDVIGLVPPGQSKDGSVRGEGVERSTDGGRTWAFSFLPGCLQDCGDGSVSFLDAEHGFASTGPGATGTTLLYGTSDGGATWSPVAAIPSTPAGAQILFTSPVDGWAVNDIVDRGGIGPDGTLWRTVDGGVTWAAAPDLPATDRYQIPVFFGTENGVVVGRPDSTTTARQPVVFTTNDGGTVWTTHSTPTSGTYGAYDDSPDLPFAAVSPSHWVLFLGSALDTTVDGGLSWSQNPSRPTWPEGAVSSIVFSSDLSGLAMVESPGCPALVTGHHDRACDFDVLMATTDGGRTWVPSITDLAPSHLVYLGAAKPTVGS